MCVVVENCLWQKNKKKRTRTSNRPFLFVNSRLRAREERARANFEKVKSFYVNKLLINSLVKFTIGHSCTDRGDPFVVEGRVPGGDPAYGRTGASCKLGPASCAPGSYELRAGHELGPRRLLRAATLRELRLGPGRRSQNLIFL